ncbi:MAG: hypothetical protein ACKVPX_05225 [Myxococcaceae bacterium]
MKCHLGFCNEVLFRVMDERKSDDLLEEKTKEMKITNGKTLCLGEKPPVKKTSRPFLNCWVLIGELLENILARQSSRVEHRDA